MIQDRRASIHGLFGGISDQLLAFHYYSAAAAAATETPFSEVGDLCGLARAASDPSDVHSALARIPQYSLWTPFDLQ